VTPALTAPSQSPVTTPETSVELTALTPAVPMVAAMAGIAAVSAPAVTKVPTNHHAVVGLHRLLHLPGAIGGLYVGLRSIPARRIQAKVLQSLFSGQAQPLMPG